MNSCALKLKITPEEKDEARTPAEPLAAESLPTEVTQAMTCDWGVFVDAYLMDAARVGDRYAARAFCDQSGALTDGMTVVTPKVQQIASRGSYKLLRAWNVDDHYVLVTEFEMRGVE
jgi:hypothetical protein